MSKLARMTVGIAVLLAVASIAYAAVTFDPATGTGFAGKGDVQLALGLNNAQIQAQASSLEFTYVSTDTYEVVNAWATGNAGNPVSLSSHTETVTTTVGVNATVAYDSRKNSQGQVTGFNLTGFGDKTVVGTVPEVSPTVTYVTFTWTDNKGVVHTTDQLPVDENGDLYTEGNNKAVLSVTLSDSVGGLFVNGVALQ
jgi:hypothetical protein